MYAEAKQTVKVTKHMHCQEKKNGIYGKRETTCQFQIIQLQELTVVSLFSDARQQHSDFVCFEH